ncbi:hypothetical protein [Rhodothermus marinus]|uniref:Uncharacterized protein n=1 Tax=Rhodothermus marinus (strain ATCC 43812 / DSM 4252 / R-10) TaxID=518766 RepID=D0MF12_RHOM4|nr:hypothetical protein [Rhodothermus marinus]ACY47462.1 hypothetical protein Rmar_0562 [Rhodothermus marinus DSM 4252]
MGKAILLAVTAVVVGASVMLLESSTNRLQADTRQAARQEEALAREIARSAYNLIVSRARQLEVEQPDLGLADLVALVNGNEGKLTGQLNGGSYEAWIYPIGASSYGAVAIGRYGDASHQVGNHRVLRSVLEVDQPSQVKVTFLESMAGYCSAIYIQRFVPKNNNGMGNNPDQCDPSNPAHGSSCETQEDIELHGNGNGKYIALEPELVFAPGNNRDGGEALYSTVLNPGERANFILAVDADFNCERRGDTSIDIDDPFYEYTRPALLESVDDFNQMQEGDYAMIQPHPTRPNVWRIAFEDLIFSKAKLEDVKRWGYGDREWKKRRGSQWGERRNKYSYGGWGWTEVDGRGYYRLEDFGHMPDFSDQVIEIEFIPVPAS